MGYPANFNGPARCKIHFASSKSYALVFRQRVTARHLNRAREPNCGVDHRAPPIFGRATITLGIGPHSSYFLLSYITSQWPDTNWSSVLRGIVGDMYFCRCLLFMATLYRIWKATLFAFCGFFYLSISFFLSLSQPRPTVRHVESFLLQRGTM